MVKEKKKTGRPTKYTEELGKKICEQIANGKSLKKICKSAKMPHRDTIHRWLLDKEKKEFYDNYEKAVNVRTENMFDEIEEISDLSDKKQSTNRSRLRIDTRKWYLSKIMPKKFGDKVDVTSDGKPIPLLHAIRNNNSDKETIEPNQEG